MPVQTEFFPEILRTGTEVTVLRSPLAPGLVVAFGRWRGEMSAISPLATGKGRDEGAAVAGALGEMAENLSIGARSHSGPVSAHFADGTLAVPDVRAIDLARRADSGSEGCACHGDPAEAKLRAALERLERAALAGWWLGRVEAVGVGLDADMVAGYRQGVVRRQVHAWRIDPLPGICAVMVLTEDQGGGRPVIGTAADVSLAVATEAALREACLGEIALLAPPDHPDYQRAMAFERAFSVRHAALGLAPGAAAEADPLPRSLATVAGACASAGHPLAFADLTNPEIGLPVFRCVCPSLPSWRMLAP
ncbi:MAG: hypothetical protein DI533_07185 [Cereibacter sphaeroides]|uniref:YcaO domain-containing protein n=1 Tax=Cereibacter sphaeroides TaxID=1063 RepID=A0A2W5SBD4_CERSP|nr:MAG: hypothetical protein DI533_07185 [Cereibacter sphaeroides]